MNISVPSIIPTELGKTSLQEPHCLIAIDTFTGVFTFVSPGNCSDRYTVEYSGLLDILQPGQQMLADKGYTARNLFARKKCFLTIPSFLSDG